MGKPERPRDAREDAAVVENAGDKSQIRHARKRVREQERALLAAYKSVASTREGRVVLRDILARGHLFETIWTGNSEIYLKEGERNVALYVNARLTEADPLSVKTLMNEYFDERALELQLAAEKQRVADSQEESE